MFLNLIPKVFYTEFTLYANANMHFFLKSVSSPIIPVFIRFNYN